mmetsp:Transcript_41311/g.119662  ORF Transcript_41311/g.119662 Transcript_41311/m.119662 type:complete len:187 (+) Transcript_41311:387-947(+)
MLGGDGAGSSGAVELDCVEDVGAVVLNCVDDVGSGDGVVLSCAVVVGASVAIGSSGRGVPFGPRGFGGEMPTGGAGPFGPRGAAPPPTVGQSHAQSHVHGGHWGTSAAGAWHASKTITPIAGMTKAIDFIFLRPPAPAGAPPDFFACMRFLATLRGSQLHLQPQLHEGHPLGRGPELEPVTVAIPL